MNRTTAQMYSEHHKTARPEGFSLLEKDRGALFATLIGKGKNVLDIGCRDGVLTKWFTEGNRVTGVEIDSESAAKAKASLGIEVVEMDLQDDWAALNRETFDVVVAGEVLEHLFYPGRIIEKVRKHSHVGSIFIVSVPNAFSLKNRFRLFFARKKSTPLADPTHVNHFHVNEMKSLLENHFDTVEVYGLGKWNMLAKYVPGLCAFDLVFVARVTTERA